MPKHATNGVTASSADTYIELLSYQPDGIHSELASLVGENEVSVYKDGSERTWLLQCPNELTRVLAEHGIEAGLIVCQGSGRWTLRAIIRQ